MLIEKQRHEYTQAYEHHMIDVQKELHDLREKATAIANDTTRDEKLKKLDSDQKWFRAEAMRLDVDTNEMRKRLRRVADKIQAAERERDWLLGKLRAVKEKYRKLKNVRSQLSNAFDGGVSIGSESSYSLEMMQNRKSGSRQLMSSTLERDWKAKLTKDITLTRTSRQPRRAAPRPPAPSAVSPFPNKAAPREVSLLVSERIKAKELTDLLTLCRDTSIRGSWSRNRMRPLRSLVDHCWTLLQQEEADSSQFQQLAEELICYPDTFYALEALLFAYPSMEEVEEEASIRSEAKKNTQEAAETVMNMRESDIHISDDIVRFLLDTRKSKVSAIEY